MNTEDEYRAAVQRWVAEAAAKTETLEDLFACLPSIYPIDVAAALDDLREQGARSRQAASLFAQLHEPARPRALGDQDPLPLPHPLDFEWRFDKDTASRLAATVAQLTKCGDHVVLLGVPTLALVGPQNVRDRDWTLIERNPAIVSALRSRGLRRIDAEINTTAGEADAKVAVLDPPWYEAEIVTFLAAAARMCMVGARVLVCLPPVGVRPGVLDERSRVMSAAVEFGLALENVEQLYLSYDTPFFERQSLVAAGIVGTPWSWRRGDLAQFVLQRQVSPVAPGSASVSHPAWVEAAIGRVRVKVRVDLQLGQDPSLRRIVDEDILLSVSRRSPIRDGIVIWTSGNRVFGCHNPELLFTALAERGYAVDATSGPPLSRADRLQRLAAEAAVNQLETIAALEEHEALAMGVVR